MFSFVHIKNCRTKQPEVDKTKSPSVANQSKARPAETTGGRGCADSARKLMKGGGHKIANQSKARPAETTRET